MSTSGLTTTRIELPPERSSFLNSAANYFLQHCQDYWGGRLVTVVQPDGQNPSFNPQIMEAKTYGWIFTVFKICVILLTTPVGLLFRYASIGNADVQQALKTSIQVPPHTPGSINPPVPTPTGAAKEEPAPKPIKSSPIKLEMPEKLFSYTGFKYFQYLFILYNTGTSESSFIQILADPNTLFRLDHNQETKKCWEHHAAQIVNFEWEILTCNKQNSLLTNVNFRTFFNVLQFAFAFKIDVEKGKLQEFDMMAFLEQITQAADLGKMIADDEMLFKQNIFAVFNFQHQLDQHPIPDKDNQKFNELLQSAQERLVKINPAFSFTPVGIETHKALLYTERYHLLFQLCSPQKDHSKPSPLDLFEHNKTADFLNKQPNILQTSFPKLPPLPSAAPSSKLENIPPLSLRPEAVSIPSGLTELQGRPYFEKLLQLNNQPKFRPFIRRLQSSLLILEFFEPSTLDKKMFERMKHHYQQCLSYIWQMVTEPSQISLSKDEETLDFFILLCWHAVSGVHRFGNASAKATFQSLQPLTTIPTGARSPKKLIGNGNKFLGDILKRPEKELKSFIESNKAQFIGVMFEIGSWRAAHQNISESIDSSIAKEIISNPLYPAVIKKLRDANLEIFCPKEKGWEIYWGRFEKVNTFLTQTGTTSGLKNMIWTQVAKKQKEMNLYD